MDAIKVEPNSDTETDTLPLMSESIKDEEQHTPGIFSFVKCEVEVRNIQRYRPVS
jgi:hypothetical protein